MNSESPAEALQRLLSERYSCRAFRPEPVDRVVLDRAFAAAQRTPSWCNTQPWLVHVASGASREAIADRLLTEAVAARPGNPDFPFPPGYEGVYRERRRACGVQLYQAVGIGRDDRERAQAQALENFRGFGAPHMAFISTDAALGVYGMLDCGLYVMSLMLCLQAEGVGSIAQAALASYPDIVRDHFGLPAHRRVVCGLSFGHPDQTAPVNGYRTARAASSEVVNWET
jgi:nitroreductase